MLCYYLWCIRPFKDFQIPILDVLWVLVLYTHLDNFTVYSICSDPFYYMFNPHILLHIRFSWSCKKVLHVTLFCYLITLFPSRVYFWMGPWRSTYSSCAKWIQHLFTTNMSVHMTSVLPLKPPVALFVTDTMLIFFLSASLSLLSLSVSVFLFLFYLSLRFVSSHDKILRVQLAEAPAWVHAGGRLFWPVWWGKNYISLWCLWGSHIFTEKIPDSDCKNKQPRNPFMPDSWLITSSHDVLIHLRFKFNILDGCVQPVLPALRLSLTLLILT